MAKSEKDREESLKIGARVLDNTDLEALLPTYGNIFEQIDKFMNKAKELNDKKSDEKKEYNNIFSILGGRGTGKTSVLLTVKKQIENDDYNKDDVHGYDIILPLIVPDDMGENSDTLGWIITYISKQVEEVNNRYIEYLRKREIRKRKEDLFEKYCIKKEEAPLKKYLKKLQESYYFRKPAYYEILIKEYIGKREYIGDTKEALEADQKLIENFFQCIEELIKVKRELNEKIEPLIYFFFDDVDISAKRGFEVLISIMRYLNHPNVVIFISGDYNVFLETVTLQFLKNEDLLNKDLMGKSFILNSEDVNKIKLDNFDSTALELRKNRSYDFLKKIMPPAFRYEMPLLSNKQKCEFKYTKGNNSESETLLKLIEDNFFKSDKSDEFIKYNENILYDYFEIFDDTPRGLINIYYYLWQMREEKEWKVEHIKQFLDIIVNSSMELEKYKSIIYEIINIKEKIRIEDKIDDRNNNYYFKIEYYIDYNYLENMFKSNEDMNEENLDINNYKICFKLFILAHFFENILVLQNKILNKKNPKQAHGTELLVKILNSVNENSKLYPNLSDVKKLLYLHYLLSSEISPINMKRIFSSDLEKDRYLVYLYIKQLKQMHLKDEDEALASVLNNIYFKDKEWVKNIINKISKYSQSSASIYNNIKNERIYKLREKNFSECHLIEEYLKNFETLINDIEKQNNIKKELEKELEKIDFNNNISNDFRVVLDEIKNQCLNNKKIYDLTVKRKDLMIKQEKIKRNIEQDNVKLELVKQQFPEKDIKDLVYIRNRINERQLELENFTDNEVVKNTWNQFENNIKYISSRDLYIDEQKYEDKEKVYFNPKEVIENYFNIKIDVPKSALIIKNEYGFLSNTKEIIKEYFKKLEELNLLRKYNIPDIESIQLEQEILSNDLSEIKERIELLDKKLKDINEGESNKYKMVYQQSFFKEINSANIKKINLLNIEEINSANIKKINSISKVDIIKDILDILDNSDKSEENVLVELNDLLEYNLEKFRRSSLKNNIVLSKKAIRVLINLKELKISPMVDRSISEILNNEDNINLNEYNELVNRIYMQVKHNFRDDTFFKNKNYEFYQKKIYNDKEDVLRDIRILKNEINLIQNNNYEGFIGEEDIDRIILKTKIEIITIYYLKIETFLKIKKYKENTSTQNIKKELNNLISSKVYKNKKYYNGFKKYIEDKINI
ncbi:hypothetical protein P9J83_00685 [Clostridium sporogenes]|uniref:KAP NTPase domain-containing protein n=1 Tax=Clostridium sporogenes TaxID=1509 RepID=A0AAE4FIG6_CLOSG|nr:hypothetical protein [Clostridium sporogenes]MDS1002022.1 hypothetical protein [Clostridium sporogenes]